MSHSIGAHSDFVPAAVRVPVTDTCTPFGPSLECLLNLLHMLYAQILTNVQDARYDRWFVSAQYRFYHAQLLAAATNLAIAFLMSVVGENTSERHSEATGPNSPLPLAPNLAFYQSSYSQPKLMLSAGGRDKAHYDPSNSGDCF